MRRLHPHTTHNSARTKETLDSLRTPQLCHLLPPCPQPPVSPAGLGSSSVPRFDAPWLAVQYTAWERGTFHRHVNTEVLVHGSSDWVQGGGTCIAATESTSLLQLWHQGTIVRERVNCLRGRKSERTGSVVRLKTLPRPLGVSNWVLKSPGCLIAWQCHRDNEEGNTHKQRRTHIYEYKHAWTAVPTYLSLSAVQAV